jgi:prepilin signal peptidase PulO-like enzyme (type II secretory pathway)
MDKTIKIASFFVFLFWFLSLTEWTLLKSALAILLILYSMNYLLSFKFVNKKFAITKPEYYQMLRWVLIGVGSFFIYFYLRDLVIETFPNPTTQLFVGVGLLFIAAYFYDITQYGQNSFR